MRQSPPAGGAAAHAIGLHNSGGQLVKPPCKDQETEWVSNGEILAMREETPPSRMDCYKPHIC